MNKNFITFFGMLALLPALVAAQGTVMPGTIGPTVIDPKTPGIIVPPPGGDIIQFNSLTVQNVSGNTIFASPMYAYMEGRGAPPASGVSEKPQTTATRCVSFGDITGSKGKETSCPTPPLKTDQNALYANPLGGAQPQVISGTITAPAYIYRIEISPETRLFLKNRALASLNDFTFGDQINVFGFYNNDGSIHALIVRNLSKPAEKMPIQLDNVELVSNYGNTLVVIHGPTFPCYGFNANIKQSAPCPLGIQSSDNAILKGMPVPETIAPRYYPSRKYAVTVDAQTIILDRNRNRLPISNLSVGDKLNIYGVAVGNGEMIEADIIRNLSKPEKPKEATTLEGTLLGVNADGSVTIQLKDGRMVAVPLPIGSKIRARGFFDDTRNVLENILEFIIYGSTVKPKPMPVPTPWPIPVPASGIETSSSLSGTVGKTFFATFSLANTSPNRTYAWSVTAGSLPPGLSLKPYVIYCITTPCPQPTNSVNVEGTPTQAGTYKFTLSAKDQNGTAQGETFVITILGASTEPRVGLPACNSAPFEAHYGLAKQELGRTNPTLFVKRDSAVEVGPCNNLNTASSQFSIIDASGKVVGTVTVNGDTKQVTIRLN